MVCRWGSWVSATEEEEGQDEEMPDAPPSAAPKQEEEQEQSMIREAAIGKGTPSISTAIQLMQVWVEQVFTDTCIPSRLSDWCFEFQQLARQSSMKGHI